MKRCKNCGEPAEAYLEKQWVQWNYDPKRGICDEPVPFLVAWHKPRKDEKIYLCLRCVKDFMSDGKRILQTRKNRRRRR